MKNLIIILFLVIIVSCKNDEKPTKISTVEKTEASQVVKTPNQLVLEIDLETSVPEDMKLMTINTFLNNSQFLDLYITQKINANETSKKIRFELPENIAPDNFVGISLGQKALKEVKIKNINFSFGNLNYNIESDSVMNFFLTNKFVDYDETLGVFKTKKVDGKHNPILILRKLYIDKIQGLN